MKHLRLRFLAVVLAAGAAAAAAARAFDERLRSSLSAAELTTLRTLLDRLSAGVEPAQSDAPWPTFVEAAAPRPSQTRHPRT